MGRVVSIIIGGAFLLLILLLFAWIAARKADAPELVYFFQNAMLYLLVGLGVVAAYSMAVGAYHTFLSITGLDGGDGPPKEEAEEKAISGQKAALREEDQ